MLGPVGGRSASVSDAVDRGFADGEAEDSVPRVFDLHTLRGAAIRVIRDQRLGCVRRRVAEGYQQPHVSTLASSGECGCDDSDVRGALRITGANRRAVHSSPVEVLRLTSTRLSTSTARFGTQTGSTPGTTWPTYRRSPFRLHPSPRPERGRRTEQ